MAGISGNSSRGARRTADSSTDAVERNGATTNPTEGGENAVPAGGDGDTPANSDGAASGGEGGASTGTAVTGNGAVSTDAAGVAGALAEQIEALTAKVAALEAENAALQERHTITGSSPFDQERIDQMRESILGRPSLDALLAGETVRAIEVVGPAAGRWRAGRRFGPEAQRFVEGELTDEELKAIQADPLLTVGVSQVPVHAAEAM